MHFSLPLKYIRFFISYQIGTVWRFVHKDIRPLFSRYMIMKHHFNSASLIMALLDVIYLKKHIQIHLNINVIFKNNMLTAAVNIQDLFSCLFTLRTSHEYSLSVQTFCCEFSLFLLYISLIFHSCSIFSDFFHFFPTFFGNWILIHIRIYFLQLTFWMDMKFSSDSLACLQFFQKKTQTECRTLNACETSLHSMVELLSRFLSNELCAISNLCLNL